MPSLIALTQSRMTPVNLVILSAPWSELDRLTIFSMLFLPYKIDITTLSNIQ